MNSDWRKYLYFSGLLYTENFIRKRCRFCLLKLADHSAEFVCTETSSACALSIGR